MPATTRTGSRYRQPVPHQGLGLGLEFSTEPPGVVGVFEPKYLHEGPRGHLHGGIAALCLDETMARLGHALDGIYTVTAKLELRYRKPIPLDSGTIRVEAWREQPEGRRIQHVRGRLLIDRRVVAVEARGLFVQVG